jgi:hypothetical protein
VRSSGKPAHVEYAIPTGPFRLRGAMSVEVE